MEGEEKAKKLKLKQKEREYKEKLGLGALEQPLHSSSQFESPSFGVVEDFRPNVDESEAPDTSISFGSIAS